MKAVIILAMLVLASICSGSEHEQGSDTEPGKDIVDHVNNNKGTWTASNTPHTAGKTKEELKKHFGLQDDDDSKKT